MITSKKEMYRLYQTGALGNTLQTWTLGELLESGYEGRVGLRFKAAGVKTIQGMYDLTRATAYDFLKQHRIEPSQVVFSAGAPDDQVIFQGEVQRGLRGLTIRIAFEKTLMRTAMQNAIEINGMVAQQILQRAMTPASYDDVMTLLDTYDDNILWDGQRNTVVEFGVYHVPVGWAKGRNTLIWEARSY